MFRVGLGGSSLSLSRAVATTGYRTFWSIIYKLPQTMTTHGEDTTLLTAGAAASESDALRHPLDGIETCEAKTFMGSDGVSRSTCYLHLDAKLLSIDVPTHTFVTSGYINLFWYDADLLKSHPDAPTGSIADGDYAATYTLNDTGLNIPINPEMPFGSMEEFQSTAPPKLIYNPKTSLVFYTFTFKVRLGARLSLQRFPFDRFQLSLRLQLRTSQFHLSPAPFAAVPDKWGMRSPTNVWLSQPVADEFSPREGYACVWDCSRWKPSATLYLERRPDHYLTNAFFPLFLIVLISNVTHVIPFGELANRANVSVALLLTQFALKFALSTGLPVVPYRTLMDDYSLVSTLVICFNFFLASFTSLFARRLRVHEAGIEATVDHLLALPLCQLLVVGWTAVNLVLVLNVSRLYKPWSHLEGKNRVQAMGLAEVKTMPRGDLDA